jgi:uncharacterized protein (TIGR02145 family)
MNFFTGQRWALLVVAAVVLGVGCGSNGADKPAALVGQWVHYEGATKDKPKELELFSDGTGVVDKKGSVTWKVENKRFVLLSQAKALSCDYKVSGYELTLVYDGADSAVFVKKENLEEYGKKRNEAKNKELEKISTYFTDSRDGQKYRAVKIGGKSWMAENLNYKTGNSWCYEGNDANCKQYGRLYDWNTAKSACPAGWHLPSREEWNALKSSAGGDVAGKNLKAAYGWNENGNGTDEFGFSALPGGYRYTGGSFNDAGYYGFWWTATEYGSGRAYNRNMYYDYDDVYEYYLDVVVSFGFSVRCVAD